MERLLLSQFITVFNNLGLYLSLLNQLTPYRKLSRFAKIIIIRYSSEKLIEEREIVLIANRFISNSKTIVCDYNCKRVKTGLTITLTTQQHKSVRWPTRYY